MCDISSLPTGNVNYVMCMECIAIAIEKRSQKHQFRHTDALHAINDIDPVWCKIHFYWIFFSSVAVFHSIFMYWNVIEAFSLCIQSFSENTFLFSCYAHVFFFTFLCDMYFFVFLSLKPIFFCWIKQTAWKKELAMNDFFPSFLPVADRLPCIHTAFNRNTKAKNNPLSLDIRWTSCGKNNEVQKKIKSIARKWNIQYFSIHANETNGMCIVYTRHCCIPTRMNAAIENWIWNFFPPTVDVLLLLFVNRFIAFRSQI